MKRLTIVVSLLFLVAALQAQDLPQASRPSPRRFVGKNNAIHIGSFAAPRDPDDTLFVADSGPGLDTDCTYRSGSPLTIHVAVRRYVGQTGLNDSPINLNELVSRGLLSPTAKLFLPAFDVDTQSCCGTPPEVDNVFFNGQPVGKLDGANGVWNLNTFEVPISAVKFPDLGAPPVDNVIRIDIDTLSSKDVWCTAVDWVELEFKAIAPILLVHGTNAQSDSWDPNFTAYFRQSLAPWSNFINLEKNGHILSNGAMLARRVSEIAHSFGAKKVHIIAHSKGGLDTRAYLNNQYDPEDVKVLSVNTLSTPHHGTIVSDIVVAARAARYVQSTDSDIMTIIRNDYQSFTPQEPAISDQTTEHVADFNTQYPSIPGGIRFYNYGADADLDHLNNHHIEGNETVDLFPSWLPGFLTAPAATSVYRTIGNVAKIRVVTVPALWGSGNYSNIEVLQRNNPFAFNDLVVSETSAHSPFGDYLGTEPANHSSMKSMSLADAILHHILFDFPNHF